MNESNDAELTRSMAMLDDLNVPTEHRVRELVKTIHEKTTHRAALESYTAGLVYLATQADGEYDSVTQSDVASVSGVTVSTIRSHYQAIARDILDEWKNHAM